MKRLHLFEFEDQSWFPRRIRNFGTDFLEFITGRTQFYSELIPLIIVSLKRSGYEQILDLASGGGGPWLSISKEIKKEIPELQVHLTDYYPNVSAFEKMAQSDPTTFSYESDSVNALEVPEKLSGFRTQFLSFHHFKPEQAQQILQNAVDRNAPIGIFEGQVRGIPNFIGNFFSPISVLLTTPFIRPFRFDRILFTYFIPITPLFVWWDGLVSVLRTYSVKEMEEMIARLNHSDRYHWEVGIKSRGMVKTPYLIGIPKGSA